MTGGPVRTVFLGSGAFAVPILHATAGHERTKVVGVVTAPPRPVGRKQDLTRTPVHVAADALGLGPVLTPSRLRDPAAMDGVLALGGDLLVLADYGRIVPAALLESRHGALNVHPSLLPRHRGATPIPAAILAGDAQTGVTLMRMDAGIDTGPIVDQVTIELDGTETTPELEVRTAAIGAALIIGDVGRWLDGEIAPRPQSEDGATLTRPLRREDGRLDPRRSAVELERQIRAFQPWPGTFAATDVGRLVIWSAAVDAGATGDPGVFDETGLGVAGGHLALREVQPAGGTRMPWDAFVRGRPSIVGSRSTASRSIEA